MTILGVHLAAHLFILGGHLIPAAHIQYTWRPPETQTVVRDIISFGAAPLCDRICSSAPAGRLRP